MTLLKSPTTPEALPTLQGKVVPIANAAQRKQYREKFEAMMTAMSALIEFDWNQYPALEPHEIEPLASMVLEEYLDPSWPHSNEFTIALFKECADYLLTVGEMSPQELAGICNPDA